MAQPGTGRQAGGETQARKQRNRTSRMSLLDGLNPEQRAAAEHTQGPVMIIAGAGSGKTRTLTYRIAHLLETGADPFRILALTFTNKAAKEMKDRITQLVGPAARSLWMGTFHSIFAKILRAEAEHLGYQKTFGIYDTDESKSLIKKIVKDFHLDPKQYKESRILYRISMAKNSLISAEYYAENGTFLEEDTRMRMPETGRIFLEYSNRMKQASVMDFDDLLFNTNVLFRDFPEVLLKYQKRFQHIMRKETGRRTQEHLRGRRRFPEHLQFPGRQYPEHIEFPARLPGSGQVQIGAELPFHQAYRAAFQLHHRT